MKNPVWEQQILVEPSMIDLAGRMQPYILLQRLQDAAGSNAEELYFSRENLLSKGVVWIISRLHLQCNRMPRLHETITLRTWPSGLKKWIWLRHYQVLSATGEVLLEASSYWVLANYQDHKLVAPSQVGMDNPPFATQLESLPDPDKVICPPDMEPQGLRKTCYSDVDLNLHMNNASYIRWLCDALPLEQFRNHSFGSFTINYVNEAHMTDQVYLYLKNDDREFYCSGRSEEKTIFNCHGTWKYDPKVIF